MKNSNFYEVLREEVRKDLRQELEKEIRAQSRLHAVPELDHAATRHEQLGTWLATHLQQSQFAVSQRRARGGYWLREQRFTHSPDANSNANHVATETARETVYLAESSEEICAIEVLNRYGSVVGSPCLSPRFTEAQLKTAWRTAALRTHPDRHAQADAVTHQRMNGLFLSISDAYEKLNAIMSR